MLRSMRNGVFSGFFLVILLLGGVGLVVSDGGGFFRSGVQGTDVAKVGNQNILIAEFDRSLRLLLRQQGVGTEEAYKAGIIHQYLAQEVSRTSLRQEANSIGLQVSDAQLAKKIGQILEPLIAQGMTKKAAFERLQQMSNMSDKNLLKEVREDKSSQILFKAVSKNTLPISNDLAKAVYQLQMHTRTIDFLEFPHAYVAGVETPSEETLAKYYESVKAHYKSSERRDLSLLIIDTKRLKEQVEISKEDTQTFYDDNADRYTHPERRELQQAVFEDETTAQAVADGFNDTIEATVKNITGNTKAFVGIQSFEKEGLLKEISDAVFAVENETIVGPIKTPLGWHVFQVTGILAKSISPLEDVAEQINTDIFQERMSEELYALAEELDERLVGGESVAKLVEQLPVQEVKLDDISTMDGHRLSKLALEDQQLVLQSSFQLYEGESTPIEEFSDGRFFTVYVHSITPSLVPSQAEIQDKITSAWINQQKQMKNFAETQNILAKIEGGKTDIKSLKPSTKTMAQSDDAPYGLSAYAMNTFFTANKDEVKLTSTPEGIVIGYIRSINVPENIDAGKLSNTKQALEAQSQQELMSVYVAYLQNQRDTQINEALLTQYYAPKSE